MASNGLVVAARIAYATGLVSMNRRLSRRMAVERWSSCCISPKEINLS